MTEQSKRLTALGLILVTTIGAPVFTASADTGNSTARRVAPHRIAVVHGRVIDHETNQPIPSASVTVVGQTARFGAQTNDDGVFSIRGVPPGVITLRAARIGYAPLDQQVTVPSDGEITVNFSLTHAATHLEEVVTTATGQQSREELGHVVATVSADSITRTQPITQITDLMQGRATGVQVVQTSGIIGSSPNIRIRGIGSLSQSNEPLIVVDGIRFSNESEPGNVSGVGQRRLSTIDPEEIENVEMIKGPSAAALYGTAAANGVVIITTKRARAGSTRWNAFAEDGLSGIPETYPSNYWSFGRSTVNGVAGTAEIHCTIAAAAQNQCIVDSTTSFNPWHDARTNPFKTNPTSHYGGQASGGTDAVRFFVSADREGDTGPYHMPDFEQNRITAKMGTAPPNWQINPNSLHQTNLRTNFSFNLASNATLDVQAGYQDRDLWTPFDGTFFQGLSNQLFSAPGFVTATNGTANQFVGDVFGVGQREQLERLTTSGSLQYAPYSWLQLTMEGGVDNSNSNNSQFQYPGWGPQGVAAWGPSASQGFSGIDITRANSLQYTAKLRGAAVKQLTTSLTSTTTLGGEWDKTGIYTLLGEGYGLGVGSTTPTAAQSRLATSSTTENATYGAFAQEQLDWREVLFGSVAARIDKNSAFGINNSTTVYPSGNVSYLISNERWFPKVKGLTSLRLRTSVGQAGVPPGTTAALQFLQALTYPTPTGDVPGLSISSVGNPSLQPEVTTEVEGGFDMGLFRDRVTVELTYYNKDSHDEIFAKPLPPSLGVGTTQTVNLAKVTNDGVELAIDATVLDARAFSWNMRINGDHLANKLVSIGNVSLPTTQGVRNVAGAPLFGIWDRPYTYADANGDGVIVPSEIQLASKDAFRGSTIPLYDASWANNFGFANGHLHLSSLFDYRGDFWNTYTIGSNRCVSALNCAAVNVAGAPLADQAAAVAAQSAALLNTKWGIYQPNDFIKLREISLAADLPQSLTRFAHGRQLQLVLSGRNLATVWTRYPGIDPEANRLANGNDDLGTPPALRTFQARINLAF